MLWIIDGLIYGFFTAVYTIFNQHYKLNAYLLGMWRGWGIAFCFAPFLYFLGFPSSAYYWFLLIMQGLMIAVYLRTIRRRSHFPGHGADGHGYHPFLVVSNAGKFSQTA